MRIVARKSARQSTLVFKPGAKRKSLIEWNDPSRQAQILDWNQRARDFGLTVDEREETDEVEHDEMEPRRILEEDEPEAFREQAIRRRDDLDEPEEEEQPLAAGVSLEPLRMVRITLMSGRGGWAGVISGALPAASTLASPQSMICTSPKAPTMMLAGFRSRWITPRECA